VQLADTPLVASLQSPGAASGSWNDETQWWRLGTISAYPVLRERDWLRQRQLIAASITELLDSSVVHAYDLDPDGVLRPAPGAEASHTLPWAAQLMEAELLPRAVAAGRSLLSAHPLLDPQLRWLADCCRREEIVTHVLLVRAYRETHGAFVVHWIGRERPSYESRAGFYAYWDEIGLAVAATRERTRIRAELADLRESAFRDEMTGLPNGRALDAELGGHEQTMPFSVLSLDFDGMREANTAFKSYALGGDVLIKQVGRKLGELARDHEYAARQHDNGDEFALLLPGADERAAALRAREIEAQLDALRFADPAYQRVYHGASVGHATRRRDETPGQALGRATVAMHHRKAERRAMRSGALRRLRLRVRSLVG
jgi:diguanylate cyclase (GGDEF)-like protein